MLNLKLPRFLNFLKRKPLTPIEIELKKYPKKDRARLRELWEQWEQGKYLKVETK
jgi:hypothetical protein